MNENLKKIHEYLMSRGVSEEKLLRSDTSSVYLALEIMEYAHRNQKRDNGEDYANHPTRCLGTYRQLIDIGPDGDGYFDEDLLIDCDVPFWGVQEVCVLHDVIEDTEFTMDDVCDIYIECGFENYFDMYIKDALERITHDKSMDYGSYIKMCLKNPIAALVKMIDLEDNLRILDLTSYDEEKYHRAQGYLFWTFVINETYHFVENTEKYRDYIRRGL